MATEDKSATEQLSAEERKLVLDERRLQLDSSFARKWFPTLATVVAGCVATVFGYVQQNEAVQQTIRQAKDAEERAHKEWGVKTVEMYLNKRELFDISKNPEQAAANLRVLSEVAPDEVKGVLAAELARFPAPTGESNDDKRLETLAAIAQIQTDIRSAKGESPKHASTFSPADFTVYIQYADGSKEVALRAQSTLSQMGFKTQGIEQVRKVPSRLQVRYYLSEQKGFAEKLAIDIGQALQLQISSDNAIQVISQKRLPAGILELWLPRQ